MTPSVFHLPRIALANRDMLRSFVWRDLASRYQGSLLGRLWPLVYPLLLLGIYHLVFAQFLEMKVGEDHRDLVSPGWTTTFYMLSGILPWLAFADTMARSTNVVIENSNLIKKIAFPSELLPTYVSITQLIHFGISIAFLLILYVVVTVSSGGAAALQNLIYLPIPVVLQFAFGLGLGMVFATVNVFARDLNQMMPVALLLWMLVSPIFYPILLIERKVHGYVDGNGSQVEGSGQTWILDLLELNPIYHLLEIYRAVFRPNDVAAFPWSSCWKFALLSVVFLVLGHALFVRAKGLFADEV